MWRSLNTLCLGRGGVFKHITDGRDWGSRSEMHYGVGEAEGVQPFQTHYAGAAMACLNRVLMESGERAGVKRVSVLFRRDVCALSFR